MMIPTITTYLYRLHHQKQQMLTEMERKRAIRLLSLLAAIVTGAAFIWILY
jgi:hypothetical protein